MERIVEIPYKPHNAQLILHNDKHRFKTIVCGRRFGKTVYADNKLIRRAIEDPGPYGYIAPTYGQAKLITWELLKYYAIPEIRAGEPNETDLLINFKSGGQVRLFGADKPDRIRGSKFKGLIIDEYADMKRKIFELILRPTLADYRGWCDFLGTPKGKLNHFYEMFIKDKECADLEYRDINGHPVLSNDDFKSFQFKTEDNPYIDRQEIEDARKMLAPAYFRQEWEASFENYTGIIYKEFDPLRHIIRIEQGFIKDWWRVYVGLDTGRHTAVSFIAVDDLGKKYIFDEIYNYDGVVSDIATQIKIKLAEWKIRKAVYIIDSASQVKREYERCGIGCIDSEKDVENQIAQVRNHFKTDQLLINGDKCPMHIVEHKGYVWDEKSKKTKPEPIKENDHSCNSVQYVLSTYMTTRSIDHEAEKKNKQTIQYLNTHKPQGASIFRNS
jgi:PBSX family phage terminase large subunit